MYYPQVPQASVTAPPTPSWGTAGANWNASALIPTNNITQGTQPYHYSIFQPIAPDKQVVEIIVGAAGMLTFNPKSVTVSVGTMLRFNFLSLNHTLTQSSSKYPCLNSSLFDTGFNQFNPTNTSGEFVVDYLVNSTDSQWFYCAQKLPTSHCEAGMVFSLNPDNTSISSVAIKASSSSVPPNCHTIASTSSRLQNFPSETSPSRNVSGPRSTLISPVITNDSGFYTPGYHLVLFLHILACALFMLH